jgi:hypothetical protein
MSWIRELAIRDGHLHVEHGEGLDGLIAHHIQDVLQLSPERQKEFWRSFIQGFGSRIFPRSRDGWDRVIFISVRALSLLFPGALRKRFKHISFSRMPFSPVSTSWSTAAMALCARPSKVPTLNASRPVSRL